MQQSIAIEAISTGHPDFRFTEFVVLVNKSQERLFPNGWKVIWQEMPSQRLLHEYTFTGWKVHKRSFDPGEKLFLLSGHETDDFFRLKESNYCSIAHWRVFTDTWKHICSVPHVKVTLYNAERLEVDHFHSHQFKSCPCQRPAIVIGHGGNPAWHDLQDHLRDQQGFEVEAFETEPRANHTIPDVIASLGDKSNMAILVLTGEDLVLADNGKGVEEQLHPRLNVIQELGKFQERFGISKTIILVEKGAIVPSNNSGILYISFEPGQIKSTFGDVVAVIRREFSLW